MASVCRDLQFTIVVKIINYMYIHITSDNVRLLIANILITDSSLDPSNTCLGLGVQDNCLSIHNTVLVLSVNIINNNGYIYIIEPDLFVAISSCHVTAPHQGKLAIF